MPGKCYRIAGSANGLCLFVQFHYAIIDDVVTRVDSGGFTCWDVLGSIATDVLVAIAPNISSP